MCAKYNVVFSWTAAYFEAMKYRGILISVSVFAIAHLYVRNALISLLFCCVHIVVIIVGINIAAAGAAGAAALCWDGTGIVHSPAGARSDHRETWQTGWNDTGIYF